jgi:hypothetical protein
MFDSVTTRSHDKQPSCQRMVDKYHPSPDVRVALADDSGVLIQLRTGGCFILNRSGARIWRLLMDGISTAGIAENISAYGDVSLECARKDVQQFLQALEKSQIISTRRTRRTTVHVLQPSEKREHDKKQCYPETFPITTSPSTAQRLPARSKLTFVAVALFGLCSVDLILKVFGFHALYQVVRKWPTRKQVTFGGPVTREICSSIDKACAHYFKHSWCLQRSVVATCMLRTCGVPAELVIGCRTMPFAAHAWIEINGLVPESSGGFRKLYSIVERC